MYFQPFRMVEDRGFRELIEYVFPNYTIPTRNFFANNMLPAIYEKVKTDLKELVRTQIKSICLTMDIACKRFDASRDWILHWGGRLCVKIISSRLYTSNGKLYVKKYSWHHTSNMWRMEYSGQNLLAVSDNCPNIKSAIERELRWKHFPCYTHTLNLAVNDALKDRNIVELILKIKGIVRHFKQRNFAWEKFKKYQEQAGTTP